ncbi:MAG TPA: hypothetical protein ENL05_00355 [Candidatus Moranbacteria bacterium]|nr:hypothetical protein [Candidatus Moranbacteria bacterium]
MIKIKIQIKNKKGTALAYALVILAAVSVIVVSLLGYITSQLKFSANRVEKQKAFQISEAGIYWYNWYLAHETSGKSAQQINNFWQSGTALGVSSPYEHDFYDTNGTAIGKYSITTQKPDPNSTIAIVTSTGWTYKMPNVKRVIKVRFRRPSWSEYAVLANDVMRFGQGTEVYGKIDSNEGIRFDGVAHNVVSSAVANYDDPDHSGGNEFGVHTHVNPPPGSGVNNSFRPLEAPPNPVPDRSDVFKAGRVFPVPTISFTGVVSDLSYMKMESQNPAHGLYFDNSGFGRHIILKTNGTMDVSKVISYDTDSNSITNETASTNYSIPNDGIVFVENNVWVEGTIDTKKVTIAAANLSGGNPAKIYLGMHNIKYTNLDGKDILGLIAQNDVEVVRDSQDFLTIDAALLAQSGRVGRKHYGTWCTHWSHWWWFTWCDTYASDHKNTITVNGSMATNHRYGFAWTDGTGYANRNLNFDNNLLYYPPPYFPTGTEYSIDLWDEIK